MIQSFNIKYIKRFSAFSIILILSAICALEVFAALPHGTSDSWITSDMVNNNPPADYKINKKTQGKAKDGEYNKYFLKDDLQEVYIEIEENNLNYLLQNAKEEPYVMTSSVSIGNTKVKYTGIKTKGDYTLIHSYDDNHGSDRFSFTINFGKYINKKNYGEKQTFYGCEKISFNNFFFDRSMLKEYVSYKLLEEMGLPVPQYGLAKLYINNQYYGIYFMVEALDKTILEQYYDLKDIDGYLDKPKDTSLQYGELLANPHLLCGNDINKLADIEEMLPTVLEWSRKLNCLSQGKDFDGNKIDVNSEHYLQLLNQIMNVDEALRYFATHSWLCQTDSMFVWQKNYGLYVSEDGVSTIIPWDYDLSFGCYGDNNAETTANYDLDIMYMLNHGAAVGSSSKQIYSRFPLFNVIYQNKKLMEQYYKYMGECSKIAAIGGKIETSGKEYAPAYLSSCIEVLEDKIIEAAREELAGNVYYMNDCNHPADVKDSFIHIKKIIALRAVGVQLQLDGADSKVCAEGCNIRRLGNGLTGKSSSGGKLTVVDENTGIYATAEYQYDNISPMLNVDKYATEDGLIVYKMENIKTPKGEYVLSIPLKPSMVQGENVDFYSYYEGVLTKLNMVKCDNVFTGNVRNINYIIVGNLELGVKSDASGNNVVYIVLAVLLLVISIGLVVLLYVFLRNDKKIWAIADVLLMFVCVLLLTFIVIGRNEDGHKDVSVADVEKIINTIPEKGYEPETIVGKSWWVNYENSSSYSINGNDRLVLDIEVDDKNELITNAFCVEIYDDNGNYFTTTSEGDAWYAGTNGDISGITDAEPIVPGSVVKVVVTRQDNTYIFEYYDKELDKLLFKITTNENGKFSNRINVRVMAQIGTFTVRKVKEL